MPTKGLKCGVLRKLAEVGAHMPCFWPGHKYASSIHGLG